MQLLRSTDGTSLDVSIRNANVPTNLQQIAGTAVDVNSGLKSAGTQRVVIATDQPAFTTPVPENQTQIAGAAIVVAAAGVQKVGIVGNANATLDAAIGGAAPTNVLWETEAPSSAAGAACSFLLINNTGAGAVVKNAAGNLYGWDLTNETAAVAYVIFYNIATAPVLGTTAIVIVFKLAANASRTISIGAIALQNFATGIGFGCTTTIGGAVAAAVTGVLWFK
jgi:hypothetical protein